MSTSSDTLEIIISSQPDKHLAQYLRAHCPRLSTLLERSKIAENASEKRDFVATLLTEIYPEINEPADIPVAAIRYLGQTGKRPEAWCICADPISLFTSRYGQILESPVQSGLNQEREAHFFNALNTFFSAQEIAFCRGNANEWYIFAKQYHQVNSTPIERVIGQEVHNYRLTGDDSEFWQGIMHEFQMWCHHYFLDENLYGTPSVAFNSIWLWGEGDLSSMGVDNPSPYWNRLITDSVLAKGFFSLSGSANDVIGTMSSVDATSLINGNLVVLSQQPDQQKEELTLLEGKWQAMIEQNLKQDTISHLVIVFNGKRYVYKKTKWFKFW